MQELFLCVIGVILAMAAARGSQFLWDRQWETIAPSGLLIGIGICVVASLLGIITQYAVDHYSKLTFYQYLNGVETGTQMVPTICSKDGSCYYTYRCAPFTQTSTDSDGKEHTEDVYHYCPYASEEDSWIIHTTVGDITVASHRLPLNYHRWDYFTPVPSWVVQDAGVGTPQEIREANAAIAQGDPRPATTIAPYTNYILASQNVLVTVSSSQLEQYQKAHLLPALSTTVNAGDQADKVQFVGLHPAGAADWEQALMRVNMEAGSLNPPTTRFDLQVVLVNSSLVSAAQADAYTRALNAYWESPTFGHGALPKNMEVTVVGTDGHTVTWARGFTLIPTGNGVLWQDIQSPAPIGLVGVALTPQALIGWPKAVLSAPGRDGSVSEQRVVSSQGAIEHLVVLGPQHFVRQHMTDAHVDSTGYNYLEGDIQPDAWECLRFLVVALAVATALTNGWYWFLISR